MSETAQRIFKKADELFMRYGIRSITMDELARRLGISKKTLYQYVENKADLIKKVLQQHMQEDMVTCLDIQERSEDAIHEMILSARHATEQLRELSPTTVYDLRKYYPQCWEMIEQMHNEGMYKILKNNLERGIKEGIYRSNINAEIIARFHTSQMTLIVDEDIFPLKKYNRQNLMAQFMSYHIHGIASPKGIKLYHKHTRQES